MLIQKVLDVSEAIKLNEFHQRQIAKWNSFKTITNNFPSNFIILRCQFLYKLVAFESVSHHSILKFSSKQSNTNWAMKTFNILVLVTFAVILVNSSQVLNFLYKWNFLSQLNLPGSLSAPSFGAVAAAGVEVFKTTFNSANLVYVVEQGKGFYKEAMGMKGVTSMPHENGGSHSENFTMPPNQPKPQRTRHNESKK